MKLAGFNFTRIQAEKLSEQPKDIDINTNINITKVQELKSDFFKTKEELIGVEFDYIISYNPDFAKIGFSGRILLSLESKKAKEIIRKWTDKKVPEDFKLTIFNLIMKKAAVKAMEIEEEFNLPFHMPLPMIKPNKEE